MHRAFAVLLLTILSFPLIPAVNPADEQSNLPACCRRDGKHHCAMMASPAISPEASGAKFKAVRTKCASFPKSQATPVVSAFLSVPARGIAEPVIAALDVVAQTEARYRLSFSRSRHKRGPPARLS
ncbi:MAG: hypothetical protein H7Y20_10815 [Bryobacteraceae bacterium]|nr:hypothetical protein [Bryobacteraceae bacterium]